jgi:hypothetical protein
MVCRGKNETDGVFPSVLFPYTNGERGREPEFPVQGVHGSFPLDPECGAAFGLPAQQIAVEVRNLGSRDPGRRVGVPSWRLHASQFSRKQTANNRESPAIVLRPGMRLTRELSYTAVIVRGPVLAEMPEFDSIRDPCCYWLAEGWASTQRAA